MAKNRNVKKDKKLIYMVIALVVIILLVIIMNISSSKKEEAEEEIEMTDEEIAVVEEDNENSKLQDMEERDRMEYYFGEFLDYIENEEYEDAYDLLYSEFKENYFPTLDKFTEYAKETFPEMANIEHDNIERNGDLYILWVYITDAINGSKNDTKEMKFVIQENDYNDFVMSFSVI